MLERFMPTGLRWSYSLWAPVYDWVVARPTRGSRRQSLASLGDATGLTILLDGIGTGLDLPLLPVHGRYFGLDMTPAMLRRARRAAARSGRLISLQAGDAMRLPYRDRVFDAVVLHLILAVVPDSHAALAEAARVVKPGGRLVIFDKFLRPDEPAWLRRLISPMLGLVATRTDVVFEELLAACPELRVVSDEPDLAGGWFRRIVLERAD
jgi:phosphatidylethanolamine/phosphatidyl-N-methylethanolamine N-methyltransferase